MGSSERMLGFAVVCECVREKNQRQSVLDGGMNLRLLRVPQRRDRFDCRVRLQFDLKLRVAEAVDGRWLRVEGRGWFVRFLPPTPQTLRPRPLTTKERSGSRVEPSRSYKSPQASGLPPAEPGREGGQGCQPESALTSGATSWAMSRCSLRSAPAAPSPSAARTPSSRTTS